MEDPPIPRRPHHSKSKRERGPRVNERIRAREVRVISENDEQIGVFPTHEALRMAQDRELDLVEMAADARPPVCKILDFGKFKYDQNKKAKDRKKPTNKLKGMRLRPKTDKGDLEVKTNRARGFLEEGNKVMFRLISNGSSPSDQRGTLAPMRSCAPCAPFGCAPVGDPKSWGF
ncbi:MAG: translation initiation factor IF-3 [Planctomycetota bacterium]